MQVVELMRLEKRDIFIIVLLTLGSGLLAFATPLAVQSLVNVVTMGGVAQPLIVVTLILFILLSLSGVLYILEYYVVELIQRRIFVRSALQATENAQAIDVTVADSQNPAELMNRFFDVSTVQKTSYQLLTKGLAAALQALMGSVVLLFYSYYFALVSVFLLVMAWLVVVVIGRLAIQSAIYESYAKYNMAGWLESIAYNLNIFKFGGGKNLAARQADVLAVDYLTRRRRHFATLLKQNLLAVTVYAIAGSFMLGIGGLLVMRGEINLGQFVASELIIFGVLGAFLNFVSKLEYLYDLVAGLDKLKTIHELPKERFAGHPLLLESAPELACKDISYRYSAHFQALDAVTFTVEANSSVAVLADSGVDRAALADILVGLRHPSSGLVQVNGLDLRQLDLTELRKKIAFVSHLEILQGTIQDNLKLGNEVTLPNIQNVIQSLGLANRIEQLPKGLDTELVPKGMPLSRMEQRLLMIARSILAQPYLIVIDGILDEVDAKTLSGASQALQPVNQAWTLVVLTQSTTVAQHFSKVITLSQLQDAAT